MKILILNWRDIEHPSSGGAEILTHELAKRWVQRGLEVVQFSSFFSGAKKNETIDGVKIIRRGHPDARYLFLSVHFLAFWYYHRFFKGRFNVVIDEIHGLPFFTPLYVRDKKIALICEVADELWYKVYGQFFGRIGRFVEIFYLRAVYKNTQFLTISESTKKDLLRNNVDKNRIHVIPMGIRFPKQKLLPNKEKVHTLLFVGRLSKAKGIEDAIAVVKLVKSSLPNVRLWIVGKGENEYTHYLKKYVQNLGLVNSVKFFGFVSEEEKFRIMARATVLICPSAKEGYGLTIPEAGSVGTPSVSYNVDGLRDIIQSEESGLLVAKKPYAMSQAVIRLITNQNLYKKNQEGAKIRALKLSFDESAKKTLELIEKYAK